MTNKIEPNVFKWAKEDVQITHKYKKRFSISLVIKEM